ncbi:MAG: hypothetical protein J6P44_02915 [Bacteroidales bacterium]|nr:hypothetical protein [Bacteroidales bacterium]
MSNISLVENKFVQPKTAQITLKNIVQTHSAQFPTMVAEYKRQLIPKETLQQSLNDFMSFLEK